MKRREIVSLTISALALLLAATTLYRQFFYSTNRLKATITLTKVESASISYDMVFVNNSTNYQAIVRADGVLSPSWDLSSYESKERLLDGFVIPPNELRHKTIRQSLHTEIKDSTYGGLILEMINGKGHLITGNLTIFQLIGPENQTDQGRYHFAGGTVDLYDLDDKENRINQISAMSESGEIPEK